MQDKIRMPGQWAELHPDLLRHIYTKLYDPVDFIRFRAVCKGWCTGAPISERPPQFPLLLERDFDHEYSSEFKLYSLTTGQTYSLQLPEAQNKTIFGQLEGYLATFGNEYHDWSPALLNPFTRTELLLPFDDCCIFTPLSIGTTDPVQNPDGVVMYVDCLEKKRRYLGFWNKEENDWSLREESCLQRILHSHQIVCHKGRLFFIGSCYYEQFKCRIYAIDLTTGGKLFDVEFPRQIHFDCLVDAPSALLGIKKHHLYSNGKPLEECWFEVYQLEEGEYPPRWTELSNIGDLMIFLNDPHSAFCLSANGFHGIKGNCIYFTRWNENDHNDNVDKKRLIGRYELGEKRSEVVGQPRDTCGTWIVPNV